MTHWPILIGIILGDLIKSKRQKLTQASNIETINEYLCIFGLRKSIYNY